MTDLKEKLLAAVAFDEKAMLETGIRLIGKRATHGQDGEPFTDDDKSLAGWSYVHQDMKRFRKGAMNENARLTPLLTALIDAACALEGSCQCEVYHKAHPTEWGIGPAQLLECDNCQALAALERAGEATLAKEKIKKS